MNTIAQEDLTSQGQLRKAVSALRDFKAKRSSTHRYYSASKYFRYKITNKPKTDGLELPEGLSKKDVQLHFLKHKEFEKYELK